jgi:hypothetical protein
MEAQFSRRTLGAILLFEGRGWLRIDARGAGYANTQELAIGKTTCGKMLAWISILGELSDSAAAHADVTWESCK